MRTICAVMTQQRLSTGMAKTRRNWPKEVTSLTRDRAESQRRWTAKTSTAAVATRNSGTETTDTESTLTARS